MKVKTLMIALALLLPVLAAAFAAPTAEAQGRRHSAAWYRAHNRRHSAAWYRTHGRRHSAAWYRRHR